MNLSSYPLILCIEIQCNVSQQERLAQLLIETFGDRLFVDSIGNESLGASNEYRTLPSPNDLRGKIIIKVKSIGFVLALNDAMFHLE